MDVTPLFFACVKDVEKRPENEGLFENGKDRILGKKARRNRFSLRASDIFKDISKLKAFLLENREAYMNILSDTNSLTDLERDQIDAGANSFIKTANALISNFKRDLRNERNINKETMIHLEGVSDILDSYLKSVCQIYSEQKAVRVERELVYQQMSRLEAKVRSSSIINGERSAEKSASSDDENSEKKAEKIKINRAAYDFSDEESADELSPEEIQLFEKENEVLYNDLISMKDSVEQIENKVVKIAELQEIFTEKVLQQKDDVDLISANAVASTENVKDGNEELRKAIQNKASIRVYILFFLLVMSFTLLFLDWYNE